MMPANRRRQPSKANATSFKPGQSGNPSGAPKGLAEFRALCREHTAEAVAALVRGLSDERHYPACAQALLDRGWGKAVQPISDPDGGPQPFVLIGVVEAKDAEEWSRKHGAAD